MKYYAVLDTNVIVSAMLRWRSVPGSVLELAFDGVIVPVLNEEIVAEYRNVLARPKFHLTVEIIEDVIADMTERGVFVDAETLAWDLPDAKDKVFYEVVMEERKSEDSYLVTGNLRHFPRKALCGDAEADAGHYNRGRPGSGQLNTSRHQSEKSVSAANAPARRLARLILLWWT